MQFVNFLMVFGLLAVAIPVIIQLLMRRNSSIIHWGAWLFLDLTMKKRRRKVLLEDILLLACRCLIPALAALAFARPFVRPDSPVPWAIVMPVMILSIILFGVSFALWRYPKWRWSMMSAGIVLFALVLAAIFFERELNLKRFGSGATKDVAIVIDGSASMSMMHDGKSNFERGVDEARKYIEQSPRGTAFSLILGGPVPQVMNPVPIADKRILLNTLERIVSANGTMQVFPNLTAAAVTLAQGHNAVKEIVIIGDGQTVGWHLENTDRWSAIRRVFAQLKTNPMLVWRTLPLPTSIRNLSVSEVRPSRDVVGTDREAGIDVTVVNAGTEAVTPEAVTLRIGADEKRARNLRQLEPGESQTFSFTHKFTNPGGTLITARVVAGDDLPVDDTFRYVLPVMKSLKVLIVDGESSADIFRRGSTYISLALRPELEHLTSPQANAEEADKKGYLLDTVVEDITVAGRRTGFEGFAAVILMNVARLPEALMASLAEYVERGGGLFVMPGARTDRELFNSWKLDKESVLPLTLGKNIVNTSPSVRGKNDVDAKKLAELDTSTFIGDAIRKFRTGTDLGGLIPPSFVELKEGASAGADVIARFSTGEPFLAMRALGRGTVCLSAMAFDLESGIVAKAGFVPLMHELAYRLARPVSVRLDVEPSDGLTILLAPAAVLADTNVVVEVKDPHNEPFYGEITKTRDGINLHISQSVMPGLYTVTEVPDTMRDALAGVTTPEGTIVLSVTAGVEESRMEAVSAEQVNTLGDYVQISTATKEEDVIKAICGESFGKEIWRTLALAAFVFLILEVILARWIAINRKTGEDIKEKGTL